MKNLFCLLVFLWVFSPIAVMSQDSEKWWVTNVYGYTIYPTENTFYVSGVEAFGNCNRSVNGATNLGYCPYQELEYGFFEALSTYNYSETVNDTKYLYRDGELVLILKNTPYIPQTFTWRLIKYRNEYYRPDDDNYALTFTSGTITRLGYCDTKIGTYSFYNGQLEPKFVANTAQGCPAGTNDWFFNMLSTAGRFNTINDRVRVYANYEDEFPIAEFISTPYTDERLLQWELQYLNSSYQVPYQNPYQDGYYLDINPMKNVYSGKGEIHSFIGSYTNEDKNYFLSEPDIQGEVIISREQAYFDVLKFADRLEVINEQSAILWKEDAASAIFYRLPKEQLPPSLFFDRNGKTEWKLTKLGTVGVGNIVGFDMTLDIVLNKVSGQGVCSTFRGDINRGKIDINDFTIQECSSNVELEAEYFAALNIATNYNSHGDTLYLYLGEVVLAEFKRVTR